VCGDTQTKPLTGSSIRSVETKPRDPSRATRTENEDDMTTFTPVYSTAVVEEERGLAVDSLDLRDAVIGDGLMLTRSRDSRYVIHTLGAGRAQLLGAFDSPADALSALDALEGGY
jgi:hypothetical protein